jgi:hypothetical protein
MHLITTATWVVSVGLLVADCIYDEHQLRVALMFTLSMAVAMTTAAVVVAMLAPMPAVYLRGFQDGAESRRPTLAVVNENCGTVTKFRRSHCDN